MPFYLISRNQGWKTYNVIDGPPYEMLNDAKSHGRLLREELKKTRFFSDLIIGIIEQPTGIEHSLDGED